jgi:hypothetical protein
MKVWEIFLSVILGIVMLYGSFSLDDQCGSDPMSPGQQCTTIRIHGSSASSYTHDYAEQLEQNHRERLFVRVGGGIMLLVAAAGIINGARSRRESGKNGGQEDIYPHGQGASSSRDRRTDGPNLRNPAAMRAPHQSATNATTSERIEIEFKNVFFNRTNADRERIIAYWMRIKVVSRNEAMKAAVEDWRNTQSYH